MGGIGITRVPDCPESITFRNLFAQVEKWRTFTEMGEKYVEGFVHVNAEYRPHILRQSGGQCFNDDEIPIRVRIFSEAATLPEKMALAGVPSNFP